MGALDRVQQVHAAMQAPPAPATALHELPAFQPGILFAGRDMTTSDRAIDLEAEELQPVLEASEREVTALPREAAAALEAVTQTPKGDRIEAENDQVPLGNQDALDLAQDLMGITAEFENVGQDDKVGAERGKGQGS